jgi:hypothetical protein
MFLEHLLRYSTKNVDLPLNSTFFLELELVELYMFGWQFCRVGRVEQFLVQWSAAKHALKRRKQS